MIENVGRMAGMPVGPLSLNDEVAVDLAWKILKATEADLGASAIDPRQKVLLRRDGREARPLRPQERQGLLRLSGERPEEIVAGARRFSAEKLDPDKIDMEELKQRLLGHPGAGDRALLRGERVDRRARGRRRLDPRVWLCAVLGRHAVLDRHDGHAKFVELCRKLEKKYGPRFAPNKQLSSSPTMARVTISASRRRRRKKRRN